MLMKPPQSNQGCGNQVDADSGKGRTQVLVSIGSERINGPQGRSGDKHREHDEGDAEEARLLRFHLHLLTEWPKVPERRAA